MTVYKSLKTEYINSMKETLNYFVKRYYTDFVGSVVCVDYIGPYFSDQVYALKAQSLMDSRRQKPGTKQITYWEWVSQCPVSKEEKVIASEGYKTRSFSCDS